MLLAIKVRLYPNQEQKQTLSQAFGNCRWLWNYCLNLINKTYKETGKGLSGYAVKKQIPQLKKEYEWLKLTYSQCLQQVCLNLGVAFNNFFEGRTKYPRFKSKHHRQSIQFPQNVKVLENSVKFPMLGEVKAVIHRPIKGKIKTITVFMNCYGQYHASILVDDGKDQPEKSTGGKAIGIDLGLTHFAITSDGSKFNNPRWLKKHERNLRRKQQRLSRRAKGSNNRNKARKQVTRVHNKISRCREDFQHKLSRRLVNENQVICVESLNVRGMVRNRSLSKAISQVGWGNFCTMLKYKSEWEGKVYIEVDRFFPSSKTCNNCLHQVSNPDPLGTRSKWKAGCIPHLSLDVRHWECSSCGTKHDRDVNAAKNIRDEGLRILTSGTGDKAYRPDVRRDSRGRKKSTVPLSVG